MQREGSATSNVRITQYSGAHPLIPLRYIEPWRRDIVNQKLLINNAQSSGIPHFEHDDALYLNKREQIHYNVEPRERVNRKYSLPSRTEQLQPYVHEIYDRHRSSLFSRYAPIPTFPKVNPIKHQ